MSEAKHTPGPWHVSGGDVWDARDRLVAGVPAEFLEADGNASLIAAAPDMLAALRNVNRLISEAAMTGFNCKDGDWAERLFASQWNTSEAIRKAEGRKLLSPEARAAVRPIPSTK